MRRSSEYLEEGYGASYRVQNLTVSKMPSACDTLVLGCHMPLKSINRWCNGRR
eukprot:COSAG01_NODE_4078_length_5377_cov_48.766578_4_plen_53_part_00